MSQAAALAVHADRDWLRDRIERRFDAMLSGGALDEVRANLDGWRDDLPSAKAIGARQLVAHLRGEIDLDTARSEAIVATHRYAKRQRTWLRARMGGWTPVHRP